MALAGIGFDQFWAGTPAPPSAEVLQSWQYNAPWLRAIAFIVLVKEVINHARS